MISTGICRWLFLLISLSTWTKLTDSKEMRVVCYYTNWSVYRPGPAKFSPQNINPYLCTHLVYAFGGFTKENNLKPFDKYQDIEKGGYAKFTGLKTYNKNLKTLIAIGGWNEGSSRFSPMVANPERRKELVKNTVKFLRQNHFDGLDLDWEYPTFRDGGKARDRDNYAQLVKELREEFDRESEKTGRPRLLLTMAVPAGIEYINKGYDVPKLTKYLDWMNILSYDYHSAFEPSVNHHAPLYSLEEENEYNYDTELNIDYTIKHYLKQGADPAKLVLGIPTYGRSYTLFNPDAPEIGAPADGPGDMGEYTRENGYLAYYEICEYVKDQDWEVVQPNPDVMGPYAFKDNQWVGYDDEDIARKKAKYVVEKGLGGIMFWAIDNDDFRGTCHGKPYPLIEAAKEAMIEAYGIPDDNLISPPSKPTKPKNKQRSRPPLKTATKVYAEEKTAPSKPSSNSSGRRKRIKNIARTEEPSTERPTKRRSNKDSRQQETSSYSSLSVITPAYTTPEPPSTPDQGGAFKCEDEGFFPHPKDCKKYFWCLGGAGDSGIIAHQFTCPAGLYFNKAADSCDYSQNVLCNKKLQKATTTTTTTTEDSASGTTKSYTTKRPSINTNFFSTTRAPPKITAATSRTTFKQTTTTEKYEEEEEYEYEDEDEEVEDDKKSEEDPKVIKELIDLIRKAGGIEELEKQLKLGDKSSTSNGPDTTTQSAISKSLYERVLAKTGKNTLNALKKGSILSRNTNSGGPQNSGLEKKEGSSNKDRSTRPQYKTITRQRSSTDKPAEEEEAEEDVNENKPRNIPQRLVKSKSTPEYVNIRRGRVSTTPEPEDERNKILGEIEEDNVDIEENESDSSIKRVRSTTPKYVSIRRQRPSTTQGTSTSKYVELRRRPTTTSTIAPEDDSDDTTKKYQTIRRGTTTVPPEDIAATTKSVRVSGTQTTGSQVNENTSSKYISIRRGTTTSTATYDENEITERSSPTERPTTTTTPESAPTTSSSTLESSTNGSTSPDATDNIIANVPGASSIETQIITTIKPDEGSETQNKTFVETTENAVESEISTEKTPLLLQPRPFVVSTRPPTPTAITNTEQSSKVSQSHFKSRVRTKLSESPTTESTSIRPRVRSPSRILRNRNTENENPAEDVSKPITSIRKRRPVPSTTEKHVDYNEELDRTYRPSELADLSSLTAADFNRKDVNVIPGSQRRRRPLPNTTTEKTEETTKSSLRSLPLARKIAERNKKTSDLLNSSSESKFATRTRGLRTTTEKNVQNVETTTSEALTRSTREGVNSVSSPRTRKVIRRFRPTSTTPKSITRTPSGKNTTNESTVSQASLRRRTSLFKAKQNLTETAETQTENSLQNLLDKEPVRLPFANQEEKDEEAIISAEEILSEEGENIKLSESNIRENSDVNSFDISGKQRPKFVKLIPKSKADSLYSKSYGRDKSTTTKYDLETTTSTTTTTTTHTQSPTTTSTITSTTENVEIKDQKPDVENVTEKIDPVSHSKEPNVIRRRKIIRKFKPTESTSGEKVIPDKDVTESKRKRKVIRRLRPVGNANTLKSKDEIDKETLQPKSKFYIRNRSTTASTTTTTTEITTKVIEEPTAKRLYRPNFGQRRNRFGKPQKDETEAPESKRLKIQNVTSDIVDSSTQASTIAYILYGEKTTTADDEKDERELPPSTPSSRLKVYTRPSFTTESKESESEENLSTPRYSYYTRSTTVNNNEDDMPTYSTMDDKESDLEPFMSTPGYIYYSRPTTHRDDDDEDEDDDDFEHEDDDEEDMDEGDEEPSSEGPKYISYSRTTTTKKSHHFESNINFNDENEQDKDTGVKENMSLNSTIVKSQKNVHNISTLTVPNPEDSTQISNAGNEENSTESVGTASSLNDSKANLHDDNESIKSETLTSTTEVSGSTEGIDDKTTTMSPSNSTNTASTTAQSTSTNNIKSLVNDLLIPADYNATFHLIPTSTTSVSVETTEISNEIVEATTAINENELDQNNASSNTEPTVSTENAPKENFVNESTTQSSSTPHDSNLSSTILVITTAVDAGTPEEIQNVTESTTEYHRRSTLRSVQGRPKYTVPKRFQTTGTPISTTEGSVEPPTKKTRVNANKYNRSRFQKTSTTKTPAKPKIAIKASTPLPINRNIYRYSTTEKTTTVRLDDEEENEETEDFNDEPDVEEEIIDDTPKGKPAYVKPIFTQKSTTESSRRKVNSPEKSHTVKSSTKVANKPNLVTTTTTTTEAPKDDGLGIDTEAIKNRNKNLFAKRKMNTPFGSSTTVKPLETDTKSIATTTESLTTLHHIFAEVSDRDSTNMETTTESFSPSTPASKIERLIEVNRIIEIYSKEKVKNHTGVVEGETKVQVIPTVDKIGAVSRVTNIKIVDGNNATTIKEGPKEEVDKDLTTTTTTIMTTANPTISPASTSTTLNPIIKINEDFVEVAKVEEVPAPDVANKVNLTNISLNLKMQNEDDGIYREERKYDIINIQSKSSANSLGEPLFKPDIIDGRSHINIVTPKIYGTDASTIPLQSLFQTEPSTTNHLNPSFSSNDELLETEHSKYVDIRVLKQDEDAKLAKPVRDNSKIIPIKLLEQEEEEVTLKARVVEVTGRPNSETIKIVPIKVEMSRKVAENLPIYRVQKSN